MTIPAGGPTRATDGARSILESHLSLSDLDQQFCDFLYCNVDWWISNHFPFLLQKLENASSQAPLLATVWMGLDLDLLLLVYSARCRRNSFAPVEL